MAESGETIDARNPATGELIGQFPRFGARDVDAAVAAARAAFPAWRATPATERAAKLLELVEALGRRQEELARLDAADNGSPCATCASTSQSAWRELRYFAGLALQLRGETIPVAHGRLNYTLREPFGVVAPDRARSTTRSCSPR